MDDEDESPRSHRWPRGASYANLSGAMGSVWLTWGAPNSLLMVLFLSEWLGAAKWQIGLVLAITHLGPVVEPAGAWLLEHVRCRKVVFLVTHLLNRMPFLLFALLPWLPSDQSGGGWVMGLILAVVIFSRITGHLGSAAWWSWMTDLVPVQRRSQWLGCRVQLNSAVTAVCFLTASLLMHFCGGMENALLVSVLFALGGLFGTCDILLYLLVPDVPMPPRPSQADPASPMQNLLAPFRQGDFLQFLLSVGLWSLGLNLVLPFVPLYLRAEAGDGEPQGLGVTWTFLAALNILTQLGTMLTSRWWGSLAPRLGAARLIGLGTGHLFVHLVYLLIGPRHYHVWLLAVSLTSGALLGAWTVGAQQLLLELAPRDQRSFYTSAYNLTIGCFTAAGTLLGGWLAGWLPSTGWRLPSGLPCVYLHVLLILGVVLGLASLRVLRRVERGRSTSFLPEIVRLGSAAE